MIAIGSHKLTYTISTFTFTVDFSTMSTQTGSLNFFATDVTNVSAHSVLNGLSLLLLVRMAQFVRFLILLVAVMRSNVTS